MGINSDACCTSPCLIVREPAQTIFTHAQIDSETGNTDWTGDFGTGLFDVALASGNSLFVSSRINYDKATNAHMKKLTFSYPPTTSWTRYYYTDLLYEAQHSSRSWRIASTPSYDLITHAIHIPGHVSHQQESLRKLDGNTGAYGWETVISHPTSGYEQIGLACDSSGNSYISGGIYTSKYSPTGVRLWVKLYLAMSSTATITAALAVNDTGFALTGYNASVPFPGKPNAAIHVYNPDGTLIWKGHDIPSEALRVATYLPNGNLVVGTDVTVALPLAYSKLYCYDPSGALVWQTTMHTIVANTPGQEIPKPYCITTDPDNNIYLGCVTSWVKTGLDTIFKYDSSGNYVWSIDYTKNCQYYEQWYAYGGVIGCRGIVYRDGKLYAVGSRHKTLT